MNGSAENRSSELSADLLGPIVGPVDPTEAPPIENVMFVLNLRRRFAVTPRRR